jgi:hypothetical protein
MAHWFAGVAHTMRIFRGGKTPLSGSRNFHPGDEDEKEAPFSGHLGAGCKSVS